jgi:general secretion pathway protein J
MTRRGFTLIELLLALAITVALAAVLYESISVAFRANRIAEAAVAPARTTSIVADLIGKDLENCVPQSANYPNAMAGPFQGEQQGSGAGEMDTLDFYCVGDDGAASVQPLSEGMRHIELAVDTNANPPTLVRRVWRNLLSADQENPDEEILCSGVRSFALQYFDGTQWQPDWDSTTLPATSSLPTAVQVTLLIDNASDPTLPPQTIQRTIQLACGTPQTTDAMP